MKRMNIFIGSILFFKIIIAGTFASEKDLINMAELYYKSGEYYNSITEIMRYQYIYPKGSYFPQSMLIMSKAFYKGDNYQKSISVLNECYEKYRNLPEGESALYFTGYVNLTIGSPYLAYRNYQKYQYNFKEGTFSEDVSRDMVYALTLMKDLKGAGRAVKYYEDNYGNGKYLEEIKELQILIDEEINRPKKSLWASVLGSIFIPGFGHFYTGKYGLGVLSLVSNATFMYLFYDAYQDKDRFRMIIFGLAEFSLYQYSLYSSVTNVYEYNNNEKFYKSVHLSAGKEF